MPCRRRVPARSTLARSTLARSPLALLLLACRLQDALAIEADGSVGIATAQTERGLAYLDKLHAEASWNGWTEGGWSGGATLAKTFSGPQAALSANLGYTWPLAAGVDAYVAASRSAYRAENGWRLRYDTVRATVNVHDRLFASVSQLFDGHLRSAGFAGRIANTLSKELVWRQPLPAGTTLVAGIGHAAQRSDPHVAYWYGNLGLSTLLGPAMLEANWIATDAGARRYWGRSAGNRWVVSLRWDLVPGVRK